MQIGFIQLVQGEKHAAPPGHPENAHRMTFALEHLLDSDLKDRLTQIEPQGVDPSDAVFKVHDNEYIETLHSISKAGGGYLDLDTYVTDESYTAAWETAGAAVEAVDLIMTGRLNRIFLAGRPPGHHAERNRGMGFCLINNTAVAAEEACMHFGLKRVAVIDWDVHHGNGTQHHFYDRRDVYYVSLHRYPFYPGSGATAERGNGAGERCTLNVPLPQGSGDSAYLESFRSSIVPEMERYRPEFVIITAGFDAHRDDPLGGMNVTEEAFGAMTREIVAIANEFAEGKVLSLFEGGYSPSGNAVSLYHHIRELQKD